ncbi:hypothetical protein [Mucilaginibacter kameinonensis]|uniref:hypothetical protein n=1 Tax=Mucilaginibacter kameinonensis TaxID=452286 RepID=UPI000EF767A9|nr:hypothetical protein [Mucilaginibacter kameinonensis]
MSKEEIIEALKPLENKMKQYAETASVMLKHDEIKLMIDAYPHYNILTGGQLPAVFNTGCSSCVKQVLSYYISFYFKE